MFMLAVEILYVYVVQSSVIQSRYITVHEGRKGRRYYTICRVCVCDDERFAGVDPHDAIDDHSSEARCNGHDMLHHDVMLAR